MVTTGVCSGLSTAPGAGLFAQNIADRVVMPDGVLISPRHVMPLCATAIVRCIVWEAGVKVAIAAGILGLDLEAGTGAGLVKRRSSSQIEH